MKIGVNLLHLTGNTNSSMAKQADSLLSGFAKIGIIKDCCLFVKESSYARFYAMYPNSEIVIVSPNAPLRLLLKHKKVRHGFYEGFYLNKGPFTKAVRGAKPDLMLYPFNDSTCHLARQIQNFMIFQNLPYVTYTEHDGKLFSLYARYKQKQFVKNCQGIITVSEYMKQQLHICIPISKEKNITVIPNAISIPTLFTEFLPLEEPYILSIGALTHQKNLITVVKAFNLIHRRIPHSLVLLCHKKKDSAEIIAYIKEHKLDDRIMILDNLPEANQNTLARHASLLIQPSLCESFGRIPIEAGLLGTPVLAAKCAALPETTLGILNYFEPATDCHVLAIKMLDLLRCPPDSVTRKEITRRYQHRYDETAIANEYVQYIKKQSVSCHEV